MRLATVATDITQLGNGLEGDVLAWGGAVIGVAIAFMAVAWVFRMVRF